MYVDNNYFYLEMLQRKFAITRNDFELEILFNNKFSNSNSVTVNDNDEDYMLSGDEDKELNKLPVFPSKNLSFNYNQYITNPKNISALLSKATIYTILNYSFRIKNNISSFLNINDLIKLSISTKTLRKETRFRVYESLSNIIINENSYIVRLKIWKSIYKYSNLNQNKIKNIYMDLLNQTSPWEFEIEKDLLRTVPEELSFKKDKPNYIKLKNILKVFSLHKPSIGYAQGLNFIVANSIFILVEEEVFYYFLFLGSFYVFRQFCE